MRLKSLFLDGTSIADIGVLEGMGLLQLDLRGTMVTNIGALRGMPLVSLALDHTPVSDISVLKGMSNLHHLSVAHTRVMDLKPLAGMKLRYLHINSTDVSDIGPLRGMPLITLSLMDTDVKDISELAGMGVEDLSLPPEAMRNSKDVITSLPKLRILNGKLYGSAGTMPFTSELEDVYQESTNGVYGPIDMNAWREQNVLFLKDTNTMQLRIQLLPTTLVPYTVPKLNAPGTDNNNSE